MTFWTPLRVLFLCTSWMGGGGGGGIGRHMEWPNICRQFSLLYKGIVALIKLNFILK